MKAHFDIYGLPFEVRADDPRLLEIFTQDLRTFRTSGHRGSAKPVRLILSTRTPPPFSKDWRRLSRKAPPYATRLVAHGPRRFFVSRFARGDIRLVSDLGARRIQAAVRLKPNLSPESPLYHYCFTQAIAPWLKARGLFFLHAGCVAEEDRGILIVGSPRAGKSTLTYSAVRAGLRFLSDEQPLLSMEKGKLRLRALPRRVRLDRPVAKIFPELSPWLKEVPDSRLTFPIEKIWPGCVADSCEPRLLVFPQFHRRGGRRLTRLKATEAFGRLLRDDYFIWYRTGPLRPVSYRHLHLFERLACETPAYLLEYGNSDILQIPSLLRQLLNGGPSARLGG